MTCKVCNYKCKIYTLWENLFPLTEGVKKDTKIEYNTTDVWLYYKDILVAAGHKGKYFKKFFQENSSETIMSYIMTTEDVIEYLDNMEIHMRYYHHAKKIDF